jgi:hypothetical protein
MQTAVQTYEGGRACGKKGTEPRCGAAVPKGDNGLILVGGLGDVLVLVRVVPC